MRIRNRPWMRSFNTCIVLAIVQLLVLPSATAFAESQPVLWNKLGSDAEVQNSEVGANFGIHTDATQVDGGVIYVSGQFGDALATTGGTVGPNGGYLTMSPDDFFAADKTRGTVEAWIQKRIAQFVPFQTPLVGIFGAQQFATPSGYESILVFWSDGFTGFGGLQFQIIDSNNMGHVANDLGWDSVPVGQWTHVAFVWDGDGIAASSDCMRIYRDGAIVGANTDSILDIRPDTSEVRVLAHHRNDRFNFQPTAYLDNIKVWDFAKTDFSDRFVESPIAIIAQLDIKPGSCPNSFNRNSKGVLPVALVGDLGFDVGQVDLTTVRLERADGIGGSVQPNEGPPGPHSGFEDVATPFNGELCDCHVLTGDGIDDLSMKFKSQEVVVALELNDLPPGALVERCAGGEPLDGTEFKACDCIRLVPPGDVDGDGIVGVVDLLLLLAEWGLCGPAAECSADYNGDAMVGVVDLLIMLGNWG